MKMISRYREDHHAACSGGIALAAIGVLEFLGTACADAAPESSPDEVAGTHATPLDPLEITTREGVVQGVLIGTTRAFLGIPYVAPPMGELRWAHPRPHEPWTTPRSATTFGPRCPQAEITGQPGDAEDCLTLNVWAPEGVDTPAPVMVNLHGGAFARGTSSIPGRAGQLLSEATGAIIVSINYRIGLLGSFADSALTDEDPTQPRAATTASKISVPRSNGSRRISPRSAVTQAT